MDKHLRLFEMMPSEARPENIVRYAGWFCETIGQFDDQITTIHATTRIEHAAMVWLMGKGCVIGLFEGEYMIGHQSDNHCYTHQSVGNTLIDALLAAAEHARQGGEGE